MEDQALLATRTWRWLLARIYGLLATDSRTARAVMRAHKPARP